MAETLEPRTDRRRSPTGRALDGWLRDYGGVGLLIFGVLLLVLGLFVADDAALQAALAVMGAAAAILAFLLPRLEGEFQVGPQGVRGTLVPFDSGLVQQVERSTATERGLEGEQFQSVLERLVLSSLAERYGTKKFKVVIRGDGLDRALEALNRAAIPTMGPAYVGGRGGDPASWIVGHRMSAVLEAPSAEAAEARVKDNLPRDGDYTVGPAEPLEPDE